MLNRPPIPPSVFRRDFAIPVPMEPPYVLGPFKLRFLGFPFFISPDRSFQPPRDDPLPPLPYGIPRSPGEHPVPIIFHPLLFLPVFLPCGGLVLYTKFDSDDASLFHLPSRRAISDDPDLFRWIDPLFSGKAAFFFFPFDRFAPAFSLTVLACPYPSPCVLVIFGKSPPFPFFPLYYPLFLFLLHIGSPFC